jgi:hypothetical protein
MTLPFSNVMIHVVEEQWNRLSHAILVHSEGFWRIPDF